MVKKKPKKSGKKLNQKEFLEIEKQIIQLELEKSRLNREKAMIILNKSVFLYFTFLFIGVVGFINDYITSVMLNYLIVMGLAALVVGALPYIFASHKEQRKLSDILEELIQRSNKIRPK